TLTVSHQVAKNWELKALASFQSFNNDIYGTTRPNNGTPVKQDGTFVRGLQRSGTDEKYYIAEVNLTGHFSTGTINHTLLFGADVDKYDTETPGYNNLPTYDTINIMDLSLRQQRHDIPTLTTKTITKSLTN